MNGKIFIPKPCHENWNKMTPEEKGRHCDVCSKVVKDFTRMQTHEIVDSLKHSEGEVCGRINIKELSPINRKQRLIFWLKEVVYGKAMYPIMALLGISLLNKKAQAQIRDYPLLGKVAINNFHTNTKKLTLVVKSTVGNSAISDAGISIISGVNRPIEGFKTDTNGRFSITIDQDDLAGSTVEIEISAAGYTNKRVQIKLIKDIQTVEIKMENEIMMLGAMIYIPEEKTEPITPPIKDSVTIIEIMKCDVTTINQLPEFANTIKTIDPVIPDTLDDLSEEFIIKEENIEEILLNPGFNIFPIPSNQIIHIVSNQRDIFNVDIYDASGKKVHSIIKCNTEYVLDVSGYAAGIYYAVMSIDGEAIETKKIIVTR
jgi:Secretion system C-terminal sorting domain